MADKLLQFRNDRKPLIQHLEEIARKSETLGFLASDKYRDGSTGFVRDICPFTTMGIFNRQLMLSKRIELATALAECIGVIEPVPHSFEGIPVLHNLKSWFFPFEAERTEDHIDSLWNVFASALALADSSTEVRPAFASEFDDANGRPGVGWNLTMGLYPLIAA